MRQQPVRDFECRVALADDEHALAREMLDARVGDVHVVWDLVDARGGRSPRFDHADGEDEQAGTVLTVAGGQNEAAVILPARRLPVTVVTRGDTAALAERRERSLHFLA